MSTQYTHRLSIAALVSTLVGCGTPATPFVARDAGSIPLEVDLISPITYTQPLEVDASSPENLEEIEGHEVIGDPVGPAEPGSTRRVVRLTADQLAESLFVTTGQRWTLYEANAALLGRPDYVQTTDDDRQLSVAVERLMGDAARATCAAAITADARLPVASEDRAILRGIDVASPDPDARLTNLRRLVLRFHGHRIRSNDDPRLTPWRELLDAPITPGDVSARTAAEVETLRWRGLCVGLATHPDFLTY